MSERATLIRLDFRGSGLSGREVTALSIESAVSDINAVLDRLGIERVPILCSGGFSGICGLYYAATCPDRVSRLVCVDVGGGNSTLSSAITDLRVIDPAVHARIRASVLARSVSPESTAVISSIFQEATDAAGHSAFVEMTKRTDVRQSLGDVAAPVLFMHTEDNELFPLSLAQDLAARIQNASLHLRPRGAPIAILAVKDELQVALDFLLNEDRAVLGPKLDSVHLGRRNSAGLSRRELEVLRLIAAGRTNREIAAALFISSSTVSHHVSNIFEKTGSGNRTEVAGYAYRLGLA
jgi:DNA-binding CsgD family transcriptional regulator